MTKTEIALQLTLSMIEHGKIRFDPYERTNRTDIESQNHFNTKQVEDAYNSILKDLNSSAT